MNWTFTFTQISHMTRVKYPHVFTGTGQWFPVTALPRSIKRTSTLFSWYVNVQLFTSLSANIWFLCSEIELKWIEVSCVRLVVALTQSLHQLYRLESPTHSNLFDQVMTVSYCSRIGWAPSELFTWGGRCFPVCVSWWTNNRRLVFVNNICFFLWKWDDN